MLLHIRVGAGIVGVIGQRGRIGDGAIGIERADEQHRIGADQRDVQRVEVAVRVDLADGDGVVARGLDHHGLTQIGIGDDRALLQAPADVIWVARFVDIHAIAEVQHVQAAPLQLHDAARGVVLLVHVRVEGDHAGLLERPVAMGLELVAKAKIADEAVIAVEIVDHGDRHALAGIAVIPGVLNLGAHPVLEGLGVKRGSRGGQQCGDCNGSGRKHHTLRWKMGVRIPR